MIRILLVGLLFLSASAQALSLNAIFKNRQAAQLMKEQNFSQAQEKIVEALKEEPLWSVLHLNLGFCYEALGQGDKAQSSYNLAAKLAKTPQEMFVAQFNLGEVLAKQEKVDEALQHYQLALEIDPTSRETKINIELLTTQNSGGGGDGDKDDKDKKDDKDSKGKDKDKDKDKDKKDKDDPKDSDKDKDEKKDKKYKPNKQQPQKFKSEKLDQTDVNKILGEIRNQEQKIQREYNKKEIKEAPVGKDW
jgi:tetratricopeptide (TPR) repeat protein